MLEVIAIILLALLVEGELFVVKTLSWLSFTVLVATFLLSFYFPSTFMHFRTDK